MGLYRNNEYHFTPDEALYLLERGSIQMTMDTDDGLPMSIQHAYHCLLSQPGDFERYHTYSYLKKLGYIVLSSQESHLPRYQWQTTEQVSKVFKRNWPLINVGLYTSVRKT